MTRLRTAVTAIAALATTLSGCAIASAGRAPAGPGAGSGLRAGQRSSAEAIAARLGGRPGPGKPRYYLALGDSLARGVQPAPGGADISTASGYPEQLELMLHRRYSWLRLVRMGCSGETTSTMIHGGICGYHGRPQLAAAARFLRAHRGRIALVTIDVGANDPNACMLHVHLAELLPCLSDRLSGIRRNLAQIMRTLRSAAGPGVLIVGMTYYVPELGLWLTGQNGKELALVSARLAVGLNHLLTTQYRRYGAAVADVFGAFHSADFATTTDLAGRGIVPRNVAAICTLTWVCARSPRGPNEHANRAGYRLIAQAFWRTIAA